MYLSSVAGEIIPIRCTFPRSVVTFRLEAACTPAARAGGSISSGSHHRVCRFAGGFRANFHPSRVCPGSLAAIHNLSGHVSTSARSALPIYRAYDFSVK